MRIPAEHAPSAQRGADRRRRHRSGERIARAPGVILLALTMLAAPMGEARTSAEPQSDDSRRHGLPLRLEQMRSAASGPAADQVLRERSLHLLPDPAASLRAALEALDARDLSHAIWLLGEVAHRHPIVADHAALLQANVLMRDGQPERAAQVARAALAASPERGVRADLYRVLADALLARGDRDGALAAWKAALGETRESEKRADILLSIAAMEERSGQDEAAATTYTLIWYAHPETDEAKVAAHRLDILSAFLGRELRTPSDWRRRGDRLFRERQNEAALAAYDKAIALGLRGSEARRSQRQRAHTLFRLRRYDEAVDAFSALPQTDDVPIWRARSMARADDVPGAIEAFEKIARKGRGSIRARGHFLAALLLDGRDFDARARNHYEKVMKTNGAGGMADAATWRLGWSAFQEGRHADALGYFERLIERKQRDPIGQLRSRYWRARSLEALGDPRAEVAFTAIAHEYPFSYYGWRAADRARALPPLPPERGDTAAIRHALSPRELARPRSLLEAGLGEAAQDELAQLRRRARGLDERLELAQLATEAGDYHLAQRVVVDPYSERLARGPEPRQEDLWWFAWPSAYSEMVDAATRRPGSVEPALVYSIMREESGYRAKVVSPVGARGLLQIMTTTGERLARDTGVNDFRAEDLFVPRTNIDLGSYYLGELRDQFDGRMSASIASYNAGPEAVSSWLREVGEPDDEWVESIPYDQTRSYVKRVLRSLNAYRVLY